MVARLAASAPDSDRITESVIEYLLEDFHNRNGMEVSLTWLYLLFTEATGGNGSRTTSTNPISNSNNNPRSTTRDEVEITIATTSSHNNDTLVGSRYEDVLLSILEGLKESLPPPDRSILTLLTEVPALPMPRVADFLTALCNSGGDWATHALIAARDIAVSRPPSRDHVLKVALEAATSSDSDVRTKAVRLLANRLFPEPTTTVAIENFAQEQLQALLPKEGEKKSAAGEKKKEESDDKDGTAGAAAAAAGGEEASEIHPKENGGDEMQMEVEGRSTTENAAASIAQLEKEEEAEQQAAAIDEEAEASRRCALYCALCTKKHSLLRYLFIVYGQASALAQSAIAANAPGLAKTMGATASALLTVIQDPPPGSMELVLVMLSVLTQSGTPPEPLVKACTQLFNASKDPRALAPALPGMDKTMVLRLLPLVLNLPQDALKTTIARLITSTSPGGGQAPAAPALFSPSELLAALHTVDAGSDATIMRQAMAAIHICISTPELFSSEALATTINQLLSRSRLPPLFMRTVLQSLVAAPRLRTYVVGVLGQLAAKQVWNDPTQWRGWVMAAQQTAPESFPIWLQLPTSVLEQALASIPAELKAQLATYANSPQCQVAVSAQTKALLSSSTGTSS